MATDLEIERARIMKELEVTRRHQKIYDDAKIKAQAKIGVDEKMVVEEEVRGTEIGNYNPITQKWDVEEVEVEKVEVDAPTGPVIKAEGAGAPQKPDMGYKDKADQPETWIPTGPVGAPGGHSGGGYWRKAGFENDEDEAIE